MLVKKLLKGIYQSSDKLAVSLLTSLAYISPSLAASYSLPTPVTTDVTNGNYITLFRKGFADFAILATESFGVIALIIMAAIFVWEFVRVTNQKQTWGGLGLTMGVGALILVIVYVLLNQAGKYAGAGLNS
ncbi:DUF2976 domain-containing protein [Vibrio sp. Y2-5]|uniref:DUF2976 domain-containing protein n=1 Tax=Vibrio sp. Y2-5 TaxID=2743977 RepID=UPI001660B035|nr:DUF2976 domain-containing protein [Vibrio sp. Y2-5]MBD0788032.1 DUF2976 domain-containing protein [Vibrio sp. Y2-5]